MFWVGGTFALSHSVMISVAGGERVRVNEKSKLLRITGLSLDPANAAALLFPRVFRCLTVESGSLGTNRLVLLICLFLAISLLFHA